VRPVEAESDAPRRVEAGESYVAEFEERLKLG
jgi:hypothetical protein